jgi:hypothetical protein
MIKIQNSITPTKILETEKVRENVRNSRVVEIGESKINVE